MTPDPQEIEVSLEQDLAGLRGRPPRRLRVSARWTAAPGTDLARARGELAVRLQQELDALSVEFGGAPPLALGGDRSLSELIETYHPRQVELVELLRDEGEISPSEHDLLRAYLERPGPIASAGPSPLGGGAGEPPVTERPIAAAPLAQDRTPTTPRPVNELLQLYRIESIKQAGAVRARRQISYEEYMSLKRHFQVTDPTSPPGSSSEPQATDRGQ